MEDRIISSSPRDENRIAGLIAKSDADNTPVVVEADPTTKRLKVNATITGTIGGGTEYVAQTAVSNPVTGTAIVFDKASVHTNVSDTAGLPVAQQGLFDVSVNNLTGLTDAELRATAVPVSGTFYQATQPVSGTVDTELPAAVALADASANPTVPSVGTFAHDFNGTTWDRKRHSFVQTTTGLTATGNGTAIDMTTDPQKMFAIVAKEQGDTSVFDVRLEGSLDNTNWTELLQITNVSPGDGKLGFAIDKPVLYARYRVAGITRVTGTLDIKIVATE